MKATMAALKTKCVVGIVGGSDFVKINEQLGGEVSASNSYTTIRCCRRRMHFMHPNQRTRQHPAPSSQLPAPSTHPSPPCVHPYVHAHAHSRCRVVRRADYTY